MNTALWVLAVVLVVVGLAGTVLPALPGAALIFAGALLAAWIDDFRRISGLSVAIVGVLMVLSWVADYLSAMLGARRAGASPLALLGAAVGTVAGIFTGLIGLLFMPLAGAAIGQFVSERDALRAAHVGIATWIGMLVGTVAKVALAFMMIGVLAAALLIA